jgi:hypothetical protein
VVAGAKQPLCVDRGAGAGARGPPRGALGREFVLLLFIPPANFVLAAETHVN